VSDKSFYIHVRLIGDHTQRNASIPKDQHSVGIVHRVVGAGQSAKPCSQSVFWIADIRHQSGVKIEPLCHFLPLRNVIRTCGDHANATFAKLCRVCVDVQQVFDTMRASVSQISNYDCGFGVPAKRRWYLGMLCKDRCKESQCVRPSIIRENRRDAEKQREAEYARKGHKTLA
jgi:hypothetical protein